jgi:pyrroline-5-carboxylate reductase
MIKWGFIGCGNLSQAIINGALKKKLFKPSSVLISNRTILKSKNFNRKTKVRIAKNNRVLIQDSDIIFVATKPLEIIEVLKELKDSELKNKIVISLAGGVGAEILKKYCRHSRSLMRVMANTPVSIQKGFFGIFPIKANSRDKRKIFDFFAALGSPIFVRDDFEVNAITAGSASGVGFVFSFMEEFEKWFCKMGFPARQAREAAVNTFLGAAELASAQFETPLSELREQVTSKKGTTYAGLRALKQKKVGPGLKSGLDAAFKRSNQIAKSLRQNQK